MKKRLALIMSTFLIMGLTLGMSYTYKASATIPGATYLASTDSFGNWANGSSASLGQHSLSGDGRYVTFTSSASNLAPNDSNGKDDVFVKDTQTGTVTQVDVDGSGNEAANGASSPAISYDGRYVVFVSSSNLVAGTTGANIYRRDLVNDVTVVVSKNSSGVSVTGQTPDINADGRYVTFVTNFTSPFNAYGVVIKDMLTGAYQTLADYRYDTLYPSIDCDGHVVAYLSNDDLGVAPAGENQANFAYNYFYSNVDWSSNPKTYIASDSTISGFKIPPQVSCDGNTITVLETFKYNRLTKSRTSTYTNDNSGNVARAASISDDGRYVAFLSKGTNVDTSYASTGRDSGYDAFVVDTKNGTPQLVSFTTAGSMSGRIPVPSQYNTEIAISPDGSTIAYVYGSPDTSHTNWELMSGVDTNVADVYTSKTGF